MNQHANPMHHAPSPWGSQTPGGQWKPPGGQWWVGPPPPRKPSRRIAIVVVVVVGAIALLAILLVGFRWLTRRSASDGVESEEISRQIEEHLPCKKHCKVTGIHLSSHVRHDVGPGRIASERRVFVSNVSVSVLSDDEKTILTYRLTPGRAELFRSSGRYSWGTYFDHRDIDWSVATTLRNDLNRKAAKNQTVSNIQIGPCEGAQFGPGAKQPDKDKAVRACMVATVLTPQGELYRKVDATTGEVLSEYD